MERENSKGDKRLTVVDEPGMAERFQRGLQRAFTMKPTHPTPKPKTRPASKGRVHKGKTGQ
jgi:hypothetical protein